MIIGLILLRFFNFLRKSKYVIFINLIPSIIVFQVMSINQKYYFLLICNEGNSKTRIISVLNTQLNKIMPGQVIFFDNLLNKIISYKSTGVISDAKK